MITASNELKQLAYGLKQTHGEKATSLACLMHLTESYFERLGEEQGVNIQPLIDLHNSALRHYMRAQGIENSAVIAAINGLVRAGQTAGYLASLPD